MVDATLTGNEALSSESVGSVSMLEEAQLNDDARRARWQSRRPKIGHLKEGTVVAEGVGPLPLFDVGDRIVADRCTSFLKGDPWLETIVGRVKSIDDDTGVVGIYDEESDPRSPAVRWVSFKDPLCEIKLAPARGNPFNVVVPRVTRVIDPNKPKRKGRPKGSVNRPKEVIKAEREARRLAKGK